MLRHVEMWSPHVEICGDVEICRGVESTCGDMWSCDVSRLWCVVQMWSSGAHMSTCGGVAFKDGDMWTYGVNMWQYVKVWS